MRRLSSLVLCAALAAVVSCKRQEKFKVDVEDESPQALASVLHVADPRATVQLLKGFYDVEQNAWRWTMSKFSVTLRPPKGAAEKGATLQVRFSLPDPVIEKLKSVTLTANVAGTSLPGETFDKAGEQVYSRPVPAAALKGDAVAVDFALDKFLPAGAVDQRELGIVVSTIGFEVK